MVDYWISLKLPANSLWLHDPKFSFFSGEFLSDVAMKFLPEFKEKWRVNWTSFFFLSLSLYDFASYNILEVNLFNDFLIIPPFLQNHLLPELTTSQGANENSFSPADHGRYFPSPPKKLETCHHSRDAHFPLLLMVP